MPKTLFGEKYVSLIVPDDPSATPIKAGDTIKRTVVSTEVEKVLSDLYPLLRTVEPAELNQTLNALATALEGRGDQIGENLETVDSYLKRLNPQIPALVEDLRLTASVSDTYADVLPAGRRHPAQHGDDHRHPRDPRGQAHQLLNDVTEFSGTARTFLDDNGDNLIRLGEVSQAQLRVLARYSTEFPCLLGGIVNAGKLRGRGVPGLHPAHRARDAAQPAARLHRRPTSRVLGEDRGPTCLHLPNPPWNQSNPVRRQPDFDDGVDTPTGKGTDRVGTSYGAPPEVPAPARRLRRLRRLAGGVRPARPRCSPRPSAPPPTEVPDLGDLLLGPMVRGATVSIGDGGATP